ncbi:MAG: translation elongation factor 4 [Chloroflexi bacterium]|nr:translation elongation factor 4 [Chloroflexota bacterium]MDA1147568.1 translation elongation factor 4 [Chloroflexota bacterium]MQC83062.1 elongation factor 4 [Chloroflexota bacterium]PKB56704.1 MAG: elongation factor 4 [SAR202 cluster bacterium Casp-Chloro-G1]
MVTPSRIRNFSIIAHIDHGKSTLADRMLESTGAISARDMQTQLLDSMDLEREKGITIKAQAVRIGYKADDGETYELNLIDTPGHVDFAYEVSRALAACEGAILVVDATQGIQAQTLANVYQALDLNLKLIPIVNKIDLPSAEPERVATELIDVIGFDPDEVLFASAKTGEGIHDILQAIVERVPPPQGDPEAPLRALVFDAKYDTFKGVLMYVRVVDGRIDGKDLLRLVQQDRRFEPVELGYFSPALKTTKALEAGQVGYVATGLKGVQESRVGDTMTTDRAGATKALAGYKPAKAMVFAGLYPTDSEQYPELREALERLTLNDASLQWQPETSAALGFGFRCGFLGLLHMEIIQERLEREFDLELIATAPSVEYEVTRTNGDELRIDSPAALPESSEIAEIREPWVKLSVTVPARYIGAIMGLVDERRGEFDQLDYLDHSDDEGDSRVLATYRVPLSEILIEFYDQLKSRTQGYAALDYQLIGYRAARVQKLEILVNGEAVDALSAIVPSEHAARQGRTLVASLKELIPRQMFDVPIQAAVGGRIVARETVRAMRKNVLAKCYGGDVSRKRKLLEKQKAGKKRMKMVGSVEVPQEAFMAVLKLRD